MKPSDGAAAPPETAPSGPVWPGLPFPSAPPSLAGLIHGALRNPLLLFEQRHFEELVVVTATPIGRRIVVSEPEHVEHVLVANAGNYRRDRIQRRMVRRTTGNSVFSAESAAWRCQRKVMAPFFSARAVQASEPAMREALDTAISELVKAGAGQGDLFKGMSDLTVAILLHVLFPHAAQAEDGAETAASVRRIGVLNGTVRIGDLAGLPDWFPGVPAPAAARERRSVDRRAERILAAHAAKADGDNTDTIAAALAAAIDDAGEPLLGRREALDNISTLLGAGSETTAAALAWTLLLLTTDADVLSRVREEAGTLCDTSPAPDVLDRAVWTRAVLDEAMRLFPPAPMLGREALAKDRLGDLDVRRGDVIVVAPWVLHRHRLLWDEPDAFRPRRFLPGQRERIHRCAFIPFGAGPRICIGANFARQEMILAVARLVHAFDLDASVEWPVRLLQRITLQPRDGVHMAFIPRDTQGTEG